MLEILAFILAGLAVLGFALYAEVRISRIERRARSLERHPAGSRCPDCRVVIADWDSHRKLFHQARVAAPEDMW